VVAAMAAMVEDRQSRFLRHTASASNHG
jgi:hypothetical protein